MIMLKLQNLVPGRQNREQSGLASPGFTLIELLAVIAVLVLLLAMLMPSLRGASEMARTSQCISHMRQQGHLSNLYISEHSGYVVPSNVPSGYIVDYNLPWTGSNYVSASNPPHTIDGGSSAGITFDEQLMVFLGARLYPWPWHGRWSLIFQCPSGPWGNEEASSAMFDDKDSGIFHPFSDWLPADPKLYPPGHPSRAWIGHYGINIHSSDPRLDLSKSRTWDGATWSDMRVLDPRRAEHNMAGKGMKSTQWEDAAGTILTFETWRRYGWNHCAGLGLVPSSGPLQAAVNAGFKAIAPAEAGVRLFQEKHLGKTNVLFCDGHAATLKMADTIGQGKNERGTILDLNTVTPPEVRGMWTRYSGD